MGTNILIAYGSKYGATSEIAEKIGKVLADNGFEVDVVEADKAGKLDDYAAVIIGSGVYYGRWRKPATKFVEKHALALRSLPVWVFSSGPTGEGDPLELTEGWIVPKKIQPVLDSIEPRDVKLFGGSLDEEKLGSVEKMAIKKVEAATGDFRDWDEIGAWAAGIAEALKQ